MFVFSLFLHIFCIITDSFLSTDLYKQGADQYINTINGKLVADFFLETSSGSPPPPPSPLFLLELPEKEADDGTEEEVAVDGEEDGKEEGEGEGGERGRIEAEEVFPLPWGESPFLRHLWIATRHPSPSPLLALLSSFVKDREAEEEWQVGPQFALLFCAFRGAYPHILAIFREYPSLSLSPLMYSSHGSLSQPPKRNLPYTLGGPSLLGALCGAHTPHDSTSYSEVLEEIHQKLPDVNGKVWCRDFAVRCMNVMRKEGEEEGEGWEEFEKGVGEEVEWNVEGDCGANTCLHEAVAAGNVQAARWLLEKG